MESLATKAEGLKEEQIQLKQSINEKNTASILCQLLAKSGGGGVGASSLSSSTDAADDSDFPGNNNNRCRRQQDPRIEVLMRRSNDDIPDASKVQELPSLILPGNHHSKKHSSLVSSAVSASPSKETESVQDDGIDYELLGKDRSKCTPAELDQIRRERNRMHAKRTRDRKRLFMEEMSDVCKQLEDENTLLQSHLDELNGVASFEAYSGCGHEYGHVSEQDKAEAVVSVAGSSPSSNGIDFHCLHSPGPALPLISMGSSTIFPSTVPSTIHRPSRSGFDQIESLLVAATAAFPQRTGSIESGAVAASSALSSTLWTSTVSSAEEDSVDLDIGSPTKRRRRGPPFKSTSRKPPTGFRSPPPTIGA